MAEIITLPKKKISDRDAAIYRMSRKLLAHLTIRLYESGMHDRVPLHTIIADMEKTLIGDGNAYDPAVLDSLCADDKSFAAIERKFIDRMIREGWLPCEIR